MSETTVSTARTKASIVEDILEQGQRLRNAMVKSILDNDPYYVDRIDCRNTNSLYLKSNQPHQGFAIPRNLPHTHLPSTSAKQKGIDSVCWDKVATNSTKAMSSEIFNLHCDCEICHVYRNQIASEQQQFTQNGNRRDNSSQILSAKDYLFPKSTVIDCDSENEVPRLGLPKDVNLNRLKQDLHLISYLQEKHPRNINSASSAQTGSLSEEMTKSIQENYRSKAVEYFKYANSLKITVHSLTLNEAGNRKASLSSMDSRFKVPTNFGCSYFVEYAIPDFLNNNKLKTKSKVDSGLGADVIRVCSKKLQNEEINFQHTSIHDIMNLLEVKLQNTEIKFQVSSRTMKQKRGNILGTATFNMSSFEVTKYLSYSHAFPIMSEDFSLGTLKVTLQLGCGRMYFGKEFVDFIINNRKTSETISSDVNENSSSAITPTSPTKNSVIFVSNDISNQKSNRIQNKQTINLLDHTTTQRIHENNQLEYTNNFKNSMEVETEETATQANTKRSDLQNVNKNDNNVYKDQPLKKAVLRGENINNSILYGLIYISEAQFFENAVNSYLSCQVFCQGDILCSRIVYDSKNPVFNFYQKVPFLLDDTFLICMRDNAIVVDFWERRDTDDAPIGSSQLSLHQFYDSYKNELITETLIQNNLPVIISDWWEPICSCTTGKIYGQMKVLVAVGTPKQIQNLETERGFRDSSSAVTYVPIVPGAGSKEKKENKTIDANKKDNSFKRPEFLNKCNKQFKNSSDFKTISVIGNKSTTNTKKNNSLAAKQNTVGVVKVDVAIQSDLDMQSEEKNVDRDNKTQAMLESFLTNFIEQKQNNKYVENSTNTENVTTQNHFPVVNKEVQQPPSVSDEVNIHNDTNEKNIQYRKTSDLLDYLTSKLALDNVKPPNITIPTEEETDFKVHVVVEGALHLPCKRRNKIKKAKRRNITNEESLPSTYVTFETVTGVEPKITPVVLKSANPRWDFKCDVLLPIELLLNSQKRFIFKVWRKLNDDSLQPNFQTDVILGFAALDLTVLLAGLPSVEGWFNIVDFSSKCNGQIKINITPLENLARFNEPKALFSPDHTTVPLFKTPVIQNLLETQEAPSELLSRALKRKFTELDEITQRLRSRLADVTKDDSDISADEFCDEFERDINTLCVEDDYNMIDLTSLSNYESELQSLSNLQNTSNQYLLKEFHRPEVTDERGLSSFEPTILSTKTFPSELLQKATSIDSAYGSTQADTIFQRNIANSVNSSISNTALDLNSQNGEPEINLTHSLTPNDKQLLAGKQRIHTLLEKLTLLTKHDVSNSFLSNPCVNQEKEITSTNLKNTFNEQLEAVLNPSFFNKICSSEVNSSSSLNSENLVNTSSFAQDSDNSSSTSLLTQTSTYRQVSEDADNGNK